MKQVSDHCRVCICNNLHHNFIDEFIHVYTSGKNNADMHLEQESQVTCKYSYQMPTGYEMRHSLCIQWPESKLIFTFNELMILCYLILHKKSITDLKIIAVTLKNTANHQAGTTVSYTLCSHWYYLLEHEEKYFENKQYLLANIEMELSFLQYGYIPIFQEQHFKNARSWKVRDKKSWWRWTSFAPKCF